MNPTRENKFAVTAGYMSDKIYVGRVSASGNNYIQKEEATDMVLAAVAQYVIRNFEGGMHTTFPRLGIELEVRAYPLVEPVSGNEEG